MELSKILIYSGITIGVISTLTLVSLHPIHILVIGIGAVIYFAGKYYDRKGK
jgi:hypothetical protein